MDNETNESPEWGKFWSLQIKDQAGESIVQTTEMWDAWDLQSTQHRHTLDHPELYSFFDLSQNNHRHAEEHWRNPQLIRQYIIDSGHVRSLRDLTDRIDIFTAPPTTTCSTDVAPTRPIAPPTPASNTQSSFPMAAMWS